jgi:hypothetical protein
VSKKLGQPLNDEASVTPTLEVAAVVPDYERNEDENNPAELVIDLDDIGDRADPEAYDGYLASQVMLPREDKMLLGTVRKRATNEMGAPIGTGNTNPILDTRVFEVEFDDGVVLEYAANIIAENLYSQVNQEGHRFILLESIVDPKRHSSAETTNYIEVNGRQCRRFNTKGWKLCVQWKEGTTSWEALAHLKESNPIEVAEYAVAVGIADEPAFAWWVPYTLKIRKRIVSKLNKRYIQRTHKFGVELPKTVAEALELDRKTGTKFCEEAIRLEIENVDVAFRDLKPDESVAVGYQFTNCHMIFDVKVGSLKRKARYVAGGHMTDPPVTSTYASVVTRDSVRIGLLIAALNGLEILSADIQNAYLTSPCKEKIFTILVKESAGVLEPTSRLDCELKGETKEKELLE